MRHISSFDTLEQFKDPRYNEHTAFTKYKNGEVSIEYIFTHNYRLCFDYINKHFISVTSLTYEDKVSLATQGLYEAIQSFKVEKGYSFSTFAYQVMFFRFTKELRKWKKRNKVKTISMQTQVNDITKDNQRLKLTIEDTLVDYDTKVDKQSENSAMFNRVKGILAKLPTKEREVIELRYLQGMTQFEVADRLGVTQGNVSQIEGRVLYYLRGHLVW